MNRSLLIAFVVAVVAAAAIAMMFMPGDGMVDRWKAVLFICVLTALVSARPVRISSLKTTLIATEPFMLYALAAIGPRAAMLVGVAGVLGSLLGPEKRPKALHFVFNVAAVVVATSAASVIFLLSGGLPGGAVIKIILPLAAATATYFLCNTGLVAGAIALEKQQNYLATWTKSFSWMASSFFTGMSIAVGLMLVLESLGPLGLILAVPPCWLLISFHRAYRGRLEEERRRKNEVEALNTELQSTVQELKEAMAHVKQLQGLIPICMHCKSIRDDEDTWHRLESYITDHSDATFTHAVCDDCREKHYPSVCCTEKKPHPA